MAKRFVEYFPKDNPPHLVMSLTVDEVELLEAFTSHYDVCNPACGFPFSDPETFREDPKFLAASEALAAEFTKALKRLGQ